MKKYIIIKADTNDGDYVTEKRVITDEQLQKYLPLIEAIKENNGDWQCGEVADRGKYYTDVYSEKGFDITFLENFHYYVPSGEYGVHTIESIEILEVVNEIKLL